MANFNYEELNPTHVSHLDPPQPQNFVCDKSNFKEAVSAPRIPQHAPISQNEKTMIIVVAVAIFLVAAGLEELLVVRVNHRRAPRAQPHPLPRHLLVLEPLQQAQLR
ncbi:hypothetical protein BDZ45DRAFT_749003 [Acephala macrosclerotiorum]|nr:hypothetical protein BDZ45DRAFT_749003 [Acephala macrosclerotiorum]